MTKEHDALGGLGSTPERKSHSRIQSEVRNVTPGGMILGRGERDVEHCYLDWLAIHHLLGNDEDTQQRYDAGYRLRDIYFRFRSSRRDLVQSSRTGFLTEHETDSDKAEQEFHNAMRALPAKYRHTIRAVCISDTLRRPDITPDTRVGIYEACELARDALDALHGVFEAVHRDKNNPCTDR